MVCCLAGTWLALVMAGCDGGQGSGSDARFDAGAGDVTAAGDARGDGQHADRPALADGHRTDGHPPPDGAADSPFPPPDGGAADARADGHGDRPAGAGPPPWSFRIETVDQIGDVGEYASLVLDPADQPQISYYDRGNGDLKYATHDGSGWHLETAARVGGVGQESQLAVDDSGTAYVVMLDDGGKLLLASRPAGGSAWGVETIDEDGSWFAALAVERGAEPRVHVAYYLFDLEQLAYAVKAGAGWQKTVVDDGGAAQDDVGWYPRIAVSGSGAAAVVHIAYLDYSNHALKHAARTAAEPWQLETVDGDSWVSDFTALALDRRLQPHISYTQAPGNPYASQLAYAQQTATGWQIEVVDSAPSSGQFSSLVVDGQDRVHVSYLADGKLEYARKTGASWQRMTVDGAGVVGQYTSLAVDSTGLVHIAYRDVDRKALKYALQVGR